MSGDEHPDSMLARLRELARPVAAGEITEPGEEASKEQLRARSEELARLWQPRPQMSADVAKPILDFIRETPEPPARTPRGRSPGDIDPWYEKQLIEKLETVNRTGDKRAGPSLRSIWRRGSELGHQLRWESFLNHWHALNDD